MKVDIIGDIHGCFEELCALLEKLGYIEESYNHPLGRKLIFLGDLTDRGPASLKVINLVYHLVIESKQAYYVPGNHCNKLYRYFLGNNVKIQHGLETTVHEYKLLTPHEQTVIKQQFMHLYEAAPLYLQLPELDLVVAHAGIKEEYIGRKDSQVKTFVLYGDITGDSDEKGRPIRRDWAQDYDGDQLIVYGHTPVLKPRQVHHTINIDTGCVFGNALTAFRLPEKVICSVPSRQPFVAEKFHYFL